VFAPSVIVRSIVLALFWTLRFSPVSTSFSNTLLEVLLPTFAYGKCRTTPDCRRLSIKNLFTRGVLLHGKCFVVVHDFVIKRKLCNYGTCSAVRHVL
jgi:hypothetical protein